MNKRTTFRCNRELFHADTCQPLKVAAKQGDVCLAALGRGSYPGERLPRRDMKEVCMVGYWDAPRDQNWVKVFGWFTLILPATACRPPSPHGIALASSGDVCEIGWRSIGWN